MTEPEFELPRCPRCGSDHVELCGQSVDYRPESRPEQPLDEREVHTLAFKCECGLGFTLTIGGDEPPKEQS